MSSFLQLLVLGLAVSQVLGATEILFDAFPTNVAPPISYMMSVVCSLRIKDGSNQKRSITETNDEIVKVKSIIVTRNGGEKVAHISEITGEAEAQASDFNIDVGGSLSKRGKYILGFLSVTWNVPTKENAGAFSCEIVAENDDGKELTFVKTVSVGSKDPELDELIEEVVSNHNQIKLRPVPRDSMGNGTCGSSNNWGLTAIDGLSNARSTKVTVEFGKSFFMEEPLVQVGLKSIEALSPVRYNLRVSKVSQFEFEVECITWGGSIVNDMEFNWIALTKPKLLGSDS